MTGELGIAIRRAECCQRDARASEHDAECLLRAGKRRQAAGMLRQAERFRASAAELMAWVDQHAADAPVVGRAAGLETWA